MWYKVVQGVIRWYKVVQGVVQIRPTKADVEEGGRSVAKQSNAWPGSKK